MEITAEASTEAASKPNETTPLHPPLSGLAKAKANLKRYPKGKAPPQLLRGRPKGSLNRQDLWKVCEAILAKKDYAKMWELGESIIEGAIAREPACLAFLAPRAAPIEQGSSGGKVISEGIRLEVVDGKASVTLLKQSVGTPTSETVGSEGVIEGSDSADGGEASASHDALPSE